MATWKQGAAITGAMLALIGLVVLVPALLSGMAEGPWGWAQGLVGVTVIGLALAALAQGKWLPPLVVLLLAVVCLVLLVWLRASGHVSGAPSWAFLVAAAAVVLATAPV